LLQAAYPRKIIVGS